jgi:hypothetical protein
MQYLYCFPSNTYNNEELYYEFPALIGATKRAVVFAGSRESLGLPVVAHFMDAGITCLYLETETPITQENLYETFLLHSYLIWLATGLPTNNERTIKINDDLDTFEKVFEKYGKTNSYQEGVSYGGMVRDVNPLQRFRAYGRFLVDLSEKDVQKFENALQTYIWAQEMQMLPNPHRKYTLYMTLFVASIEQLADEQGHNAVGGKECKSKIVCPDCSVEIYGYHKSGIAKNCENLIRELLTGDKVDEAASLFKMLYSKVRSGYIHAGKLSGDERSGGFLVGGMMSDSQKSIIENMANIENLSRMMLELFLQKRSRSVK